jgi:hypothetical protein
MWALMVILHVYALNSGGIAVPLDRFSGDPRMSCEGPAHIGNSERIWSATALLAAP